MLLTSSASAKTQGNATGRDRRLTVIVFSLFFSWLLAVPFEGQVLYAVAAFHGVSAQSFVFGAMAAHFVGLITCGFLVRNMGTAKKFILCSIAFCAAATGVFFMPPSFLWTAALLLASFLVGVCVAAWGFYFKSCTQKDGRIKTMADCLIFSNLLMIALNMTAIHISPQIGLGFSITVLAAAFLFALSLPQGGAPQEPVKPPAAQSNAIKSSKFGAMAFLCLFIVIITINSGLMYQVVNPAFAHMKALTSWYWVVPYIVALFIMRSLPGKVSHSYSLYVAIAMIGFSFILFLLFGRMWQDYLLINTLMLGAFGVYDLFWWSILGDMLEHDKNPAKIIGIGLSANVFGVLLGGLIGTAITAISDSNQNHTLLALGVVCATLIMLPPLHKRLTGFLKSHFYLTVFSEVPEKEQKRILRKLEFSEPLTKRENEVMALLVAGMAYKAIAAQLHISENTVGTHARTVYSKASVANRVELMDLLYNPPAPESE